MSKLSFFLQDTLIAALSAPGAMIGLLTQEPNADGTGVVEPNVIYGYNRQPVTFMDPVRGAGADLGKTVLKNDNALVFGAAHTMAWPPMTHVAVFDADENMLASSPLGTPRTAPIGDAVSFGAEAIVLKFK